MKFGRTPGSGEPFLAQRSAAGRTGTRYVSEAVGIVIARTTARAADHAEHIIIEYEELPCVMGHVNAGASGAPNGLGRGARRRLRRSALRRFGGERRGLRQGRSHGAAANPASTRWPGDHRRRAALADHDAATRRSTLYAGSSSAVRHKREHSTAFGIDANDLARVLLRRRRHFGRRGPRLAGVRVGAVEPSVELGRPVNFTATRSETFFVRLSRPRSGGGGSSCRRSTRNGSFLSNVGR